MKRVYSAGFAGLALFALHAAPAHADSGYCREYTRKVVIGDTVQNAYGTACRQPDGSWQIMNQQQGDQAVQPVPPPPDAQVSYVVQDQQPVYVQPQYVSYPYWENDYAYGYPFWVGGYYYGGHGGYDSWRGVGYGGGRGGYGGGGYGGGRGYR